MSIFFDFFDTFWGHVYRIDMLFFTGVTYGLPGNFVLTPGRYVGAEDVVDDGEPFEEKMGRLAAKLGEQFRESQKLERDIQKNLKEIGYTI